MVDISRQTVYRYSRMRDPPQRKHPKPRCKLLDPYKDYLVRRWEEGCHNRKRLLREIQEQGYGYSDTNVYRFFSELRRAKADGGGQASGTSGVSVHAPSTHHVATLFVRRTEDLSERQSTYVKQLCESSEETSKAYELTKEFCAMLRQLRGEDLDVWTGMVEESNVVELQRFVQSLKKDEAAVRAGLALQWSAGQTEGQVTRLNNVSWDGFDRHSLPSSRSG